MDADIALLEKRTEVKDAISKGIENTIPAYFFNLIGDALAKLFHLTKRSPWVVNAVILGMLLSLPGFLISVLTGEVFSWGELHLFYLGLWLIGYLNPIVAHLNLAYNVLPGIRDNIIDSFQDMKDLDDFSRWLSSFWSVGKWMAVNICIGIPYLILYTIDQNHAVGQFIGFGILTMNLLQIPLFVSALYIFYRILSLPPLLASYRLILYESDPVNSDVLQHLVYILNIYLYYVAGYMAILTSFIVLHPTPWSLWFAILLGWVPTIMQFLVNQYSIRKIIITAKWRNLNRLQEQIKDLQNADLKEAPEATIVRINKLMDLHDRISARPNSMLTWSTGLSFFNQLMLPVLGFLLGNIDKFLKLINP